MAPLTSRQQEVLTSIKDFIRTHGFSPTLREIAQAIGVKSTNCVDDHLRSLARKGYLRRGTQARSVVVVGEKLDPLMAEERALVEAVRAEVEEMLRQSPGVQERAADLSIAPGNKVLALPRLLAVIDRLAPGKP